MTISLFLGLISTLINFCVIDKSSIDSKLGISGILLILIFLALVYTLWVNVGQEIIEIRGNFLIVTYAIFNSAWVKRYALSDIQSFLPAKEIYFGIDFFKKGMSDMVYKNRAYFFWSSMGTIVIRFKNGKEITVLSGIKDSKTLNCILDKLNGAIVPSISA